MSGEGLIWRPVSRRGALRTFGLVAGGAAATLALGGRAGAQQAPTFPSTVGELARLAEDTWEWTYQGYNMLIIVGDDGVLVTDPSSQFAMRGSTLYKAVVASITDKPVKWLVYSHDHADHATGGDVFAETAEFVGHRIAADKIGARGDARTPTPTTLLDDTLSVNLGGRAVELRYLGRNHSDNMIVVHYPARGILYAVDWIPVRAVQFRALPDAYPEEWIESFRRAEALDFTTLVPGHGSRGTKQSVTEAREYLQDLMASVRAARGRGLGDNSPEMVEAVRTDLAPKYSTWNQFGPWLPENIQGVLQYMTTGETSKVCCAQPWRWA